MNIKHWGTSLLVLLLVACNGQSPAGENIPENTVSHLNILISLDEQWENQSTYEHLFKEFQKQNPDIVLNPSYVFADTEAILKLIYAPSAQQSFHLAILGAEQLYQMLDLELILPMDQYILQDKGRYWLNDLSSYTMGNATYKGNIWSLPIVRNVVVAYINTQQAGPVETPLTLDALVKMAERYAQKSEGPFASAQWSRLLVRYASYYSEMPPPSQAGVFVSFYSPEKAELLDKVAKLYRESTLINGDSALSRDAEQFSSRELPVLIQESLMHKEIVARSDFEMQVVPLYLDTETTFPAFGSNIYLIAQPDKKLEVAAWSTLSWLVDNNLRLQAMEKSMPLSHMVQQKLALEVQREGADTFTTISAVPYNSFDSLSVYQRPKIFKIVESTISRVIAEDQSSGDMLIQLQEDVHQILGKHLFRVQGE